MPDLLFDRECAALGELWRLIEARRAGAEELSVASVRDEQIGRAAEENELQILTEKQERERAETDAATQKEEKSLSVRLAAEEAVAQSALAEERRRLEAEEREGRERIEGALKDALWMADSVAEGERKNLQEQLQTVRSKAKAHEEQIASRWTELEPLLSLVALEREDVEPEKKSPQTKGKSPADPEASLIQASELMRFMREQALLKWMGWPRTLVVAVLVWAVVSLPALWLRPPIIWPIIGFMAGLLAALGTRTFLHSLARKRLQFLGAEFAGLLHEAGRRINDQVRHAETELAARRTDVHNKCIVERRHAQAIHKPLLDKHLERIRSERDTLERQYDTSIPALLRRNRQTLETARQRHKEARARCCARHEKERHDAETARTARIRDLDLTSDRKARKLQQLWESGANTLLAIFSELQASGSRVRETNSSSPNPGPLTPELPFGTLTVNVRELTGEMEGAKLAPMPASPIQVPVFLPFPRLGGLLLQAFGQGRMVAVQVLQALMLRFLTSLPPGKVRFTILDPVGLGENFAAFMHLADHDEALISSRIWTEPAHIDKQLTDLTVHMENVIQKYLRSQFRSIEDYNARAGEVAEPYRILVVANFPNNFTPQAARRLVSIVQSGSSCGVYALISLDTRQPLPQGFQVEDLEQLCLNLFWREDQASVASDEESEIAETRLDIALSPVRPAPVAQGQFRWRNPDLDRFPLELEMPPAIDRVIETVQRVGALSRDATRVRVPFSFIAPAEDEVWKGDSRNGIAVPLGRSGAVRRLSLQLGQGTSQHVLVAGKTGSGKSTLWHALIANLALIYSPEEVELYLIDFKKGVEFKPYATHLLPHARVIAVESEREFGLSVLQRLDSELRQRGDLFRAAGVNDVASYRQSRPESRCPRILFIVDEFQEFFVEDDRLSQEAALLLDRLVRQGRAFGLHVLLGSQTLGGAYSLARSTIDQMAVRIALQCSEADARLILDKDNGAARLLSRPGEAIYNDTNGSIEGNEVFQVVWLPEEQREEALRTVRKRVEQQLPNVAARLPLVFEGNTPAELEHNPILACLLLSARSVSGDGKTEGIGKAWLGEPIAIKEPTAALFRPQTGNNLLIVGQNDEAALAMFASALIGVAVQAPTAQFLVMDGTDAHAPHAGYLKALMESWPGSMAMVERTGITAALAALSEEMNLRHKGTSSDRSERYLLINGLQRYREFRRADDDVGFGRRGAERTISPLEHLQSLLRDGPLVGIHLLIWCDSLANVTRSLDRQGLRECGQRVLFQMSAADSSHLLDSPLASRLGQNRALFYTEEMAQAEKFRPYGLPSLAWVSEIKERLFRGE